MRGRPWRVGRLVVMVALASFGSACNAILGPTQVDHNWHVHDGPHFSLYVRPGSFAEQNAARLSEVLEDQYAVTVSALDLRYAGRISAFLYPSAAEAALDSDRSGVAYPDTEALRAVCVSPLDGNLFALLSHEANHVIQQNALGRPGTFFLSEGLPSAVLSERFHPYGRTFLYGWTASHASQIPPLALLADDTKWDGYSTEVAYNTSASFLAYLLDLAGPQLLKQLHPVSSGDFGQRFRDIYGRPLEEVEREWRDFCAKSAGR